MTRWAVGDPLPLVLRDVDLIGVLNISSSLFYKRKALREYAFLELATLNTSGASSTEYSGDLVRRWLAGESAAAIAASRGLRFFGTARVAAAAAAEKRRPGRPRKNRAVQDVARVVVAHDDTIVRDRAAG